MDRRKFIQDSLLIAGGAVLTSRKAMASAEKSGPQYIREKIPFFEMAPYRGTRYEDQVPATLDLAERAELGINCLTGITDEKCDHEIFWEADFFKNPAVMRHDFNDWCQNVEGMLESLPLLRMASGSTANDNVDKVWTETLLKSIGPDGLVYTPLNGRPWSRLRHCWVTPVWKADGTTADFTDKSVSQITQPNLWPRAIAAMIIHYHQDNNSMWRQTIESMITGMSALVSDEGDYAFFPPGCYEPKKRFSGGGAAGEQEMPSGFLALDGGNVRVIQGLAQYHRLTGYEPARILAEKLTKFIRYRSDAFDPEGRFRFSAFEKGDAEWFVKYSRANGGNLTLEGVKGQTLGGHFHSHTIGILGIVDYAVAAHDREMLDWCKSSYEWAKTQGSSLVGFFPEFIVPQYPSCESCEVADMIALALKLTQAGVGDYWDDADRWTRNQFAENQLTNGDWIARNPKSISKQSTAYYESMDSVAKRNIGGFAGWASGNEWALHNGIMHCCTGNSTRAIYYIWKNIVESKGDEFRVNLLLNRASAEADVYSFIPYEGKVKVKMKKPFGRVLVRMPEWIKSGGPDVTCKVGGTRRDVNWEGRYINTGGVESGGVVEVTFPIATRTVTETLGTTNYRLEIKGNTVVSIDPPGSYAAIYQRTQFRSNEAPSRRIQRFVADAELDW
jgi:hypothetical protein